MTPNRVQHPLRRWAAVLSCMACLFTAPGCEFKAVDPTGATGASATDDGYWRPDPVKVRVYPSTRFIEESGRAILEARVELFDSMGDPVKSTGKFRIELFSVDEALGSVPRRLLYSWNADVLTLDQQKEHYDPITRGYKFKLGVDDLGIANEVTMLRVSFAPVGRARLEETESLIRSDW